MDRPRIPPGQVVTQKFPVLHMGSIPPFDPSTWDLRVFGLVETELAFNYQEFMRLPTVQDRSDFHCVTRWSRLDNLWEGVRVKDILKLAQPKPEAKYVMVHCDAGYSTNLPLETILDDDVLLAYRHDGADLAPEHGWPLRLVVPKRYAYKSAKWVRGLELMAQDRPGFWEERGYHNDADPWLSQRYSS